MIRAARSAAILVVPASLVLAGAALVAGAAPAPVPGPRGDDLRAAQELLAARDFDGAARLLADRLRRGASDGALCELYARTLANLARLDESAHWYEQAAQCFAGESQDPAARQALTGMRRSDPLAARREAFFAKLSSTLADCGAELLEQGHNLRAIELLERLPPIATGKTSERVAELLAKARAAFERLDLDSSGAEAAASARPLLEFESKHYKLAANLEQETAQRVADLMDDLHGFYVQVYF